MGTLKSNLILRGEIMTYIVDFEVEADNYEDAVSSAEEIIWMMNSLMSNSTRSWMMSCSSSGRV